MAASRFMPASVQERAALGAEGVNILNASGPGSEQSVPHLHFHVIPRWEGVAMARHASGAMADMGELRELAEAIQQALP